MMIDQAAGEKLTKGWEGCELKVYKDSRGFLTIGWGFNLQANGAALTCANVGANYQALCQGVDELTQEQADAIFDQLYGDAVGAAREDVANFDDLSDPAQQVVADMAYNLGKAGLAKFHNFIAALAIPDYQKAADEMVDSAWYTQVGRRGVGDVALMRSAA